MKTTNNPILIILAALSVAFAARAQPVNISTVAVGNPGNAPAADGRGSVGYNYSIGTYTVTLTQYTAFLNAVASSDPYKLYSTSMATYLNVAGIARTGNSGGYTYSVIGDGQRPVTLVSWLSAARFCNWLHNGQPTTLGEAVGSTETGAYTLNGDITNGLETANPGAIWRLPTEDEWYKAAYYDPTLNGGTGGYWLFPTRSNSAPGNDATHPTLPNQANYITSVLSVTQSGTYSSLPNYLTPVGAFTNSASAYGTYDQAGNVWQWNDAVINVFGTFLRGFRGGSWENGVNSVSSGSNITGLAPTSNTGSYGFRVVTVAPASVPSPSVVPVVDGAYASRLALTVAFQGSGRITQMAWGPGGRLYAVCSTGGIVSFHYDAASGTLSDMQVASDISGTGIGFVLERGEMYVSANNSLWRLTDANGNGRWGMDAGDIRVAIVSEIPVSLHPTGQIQMRGNTLFIGIGIRGSDGGTGTWPDAPEGECALGGAICWIQDVSQVPSVTDAARLLGAINIQTIQNDSSPYTSTAANKLVVHSAGTCNPFGLALNSNGDLFFTNNYNHADTHGDGTSSASGSLDAQGADLTHSVHDQFFKAAAHADYGFRNDNWRGVRSPGVMASILDINNPNHLAVNSITPDNLRSTDPNYLQLHDPAHPVGLGPSSLSKGFAFWHHASLPSALDGAAFVARWNSVISESAPGTRSITYSDLVAVDPLSGVVRRIAYGFTNPLAVLADDHGHLLVADWGAGAVFTFTASGGVTQPPDPPPATSSASAQFVTLDTQTKGNWTASYGGDGSNVMGDTASYPSYATVGITGAASYTWEATTSDVRALRKNSVPTERIAGCAYSPTLNAGSNFVIDVNLSDSQAHRMALYALDWDSYGPRTEKIEVIDSSTGTVLDTQTLTSFQGGQYLVWNIQGHVKIRVTNNKTGSNAVVGGIFFGTGGVTQPPDPPPATSSASAQFVTLDTQTKGNWTASYGGDGFNVMGDTTSYPSYATVGITGAASYTWEATTSDVRALRKNSAPAERIAGCAYSPTLNAGSNFVIDVNLSDGQAHQVALYALDWDSYGPRTEKIEVIDFSTGNVLDTRTLTYFQGGQYLVWNIQWHVIIRVTNNQNGSNAVIGGIFFGEGNSSATSAQFVTLDTQTKGNWTASYGGDGFNVMGDAASYPSYSTVGITGAASYTWEATTSDVRALRKNSAPAERIAGCAYSPTLNAGSNFVIDVNLSDGQAHQMALYALDWDSYGPRTEKIEVVNATTGNVLDTRTLTYFQGGQYLVWNIQGHVKIRVTNNQGGSNAVVGGIFFGNARSN